MSESSTAPRLHAALRAVYDRFGPRLAASMTHPLLADVAYVARMARDGAAQGTSAAV